MKNKNKGEIELLKKMFKQVLILYHKQEEDRMMYGNSFIEFTPRKIEIKDPSKIKGFDKILWII